MDSKVHGAGSHQFDRKIASFAVTAADVIILNLWAHDVDRKGAAGYYIFEKIVEDHMLELTKSKAVRKKKIVVVFRDIDLESMSGDLLDGEDVVLSRLQDVVDQHANLDRREVGDISKIFSISFVGLPHIQYMRNEFKERAADLRKRFKDPKHSEVS